MKHREQRREQKEHQRTEKPTENEEKHRLQYAGTNQLTKHVFTQKRGRETYKECGE